MIYKIHVWKFAHFPEIKNTIKWVLFENAFESTMSLHFFLFANIPAESMSYAPTSF